ncbi:hypothetical protein BKA69DRAFT_1039128 [Paraphysoderma sedebokerense]|nr:hypothetical protein BKA69DRAFT_1039128 [Paraphysoderma sedebokerense]
MQFFKSFIGSLLVLQLVLSTTSLPQNQNIGAAIANNVVNDGAQQSNNVTITGLENGVTQFAAGASAGKHGKTQPLNTDASISNNTASGNSTQVNQATNIQSHGDNNQFLTVGSIRNTTNVDNRTIHDNRNVTNNMQMTTNNVFKQEVVRVMNTKTVVQAAPSSNTKEGTPAQFTGEQNSKRKSTNSRLNKILSMWRQVLDSSINVIIEAAGEN